MQGTASTAHPSVPMGDLFFSDCRLFWYFHTPLPPLQADNGALIAHWQRLPGFGELLPPPALLPCVAAFTCSESSGSETSKGGGGTEAQLPKAITTAVCLPPFGCTQAVCPCVAPQHGGPVRPPSHPSPAHRGRHTKHSLFLFASPPRCPDTRMLSCGSSVPAASAHAPTSPGEGRDVGFDVGNSGQH